MSTPSALMGTPRVGDRGTILIATVYDNQNGTLVLLDLTSYTTLQMDIENESGAITGSPFTAVLSGPAVNGQVKYQTSSVTSLFTTPGAWRYRPIITSGTGNQYRGSWVLFNVEP